MYGAVLVDPGEMKTFAHVSTALRSGCGATHILQTGAVFVLVEVVALPEAQ